MDTPVVCNNLLQTHHGLFEFGAVAVGQKVFEERVLRFDEQVRKRVGIRGVTGLGAFGLGHIEFVEQHGLQLLGRI